MTTMRFAAAALALLFLSCSKGVENDLPSSVPGLPHPIDVRITSMNSAAAVIVWRLDQVTDTAVVRAASIDIEQSMDGVSFTVVNNVPATFNHDTLAGPFDTSHTYHFRLRLRLSDASSVYSGILKYNSARAAELSAAAGGQVLVIGGTFVMGSHAGEGESNEHPQHPVTLSSFYMGRTEVTRRQWREVVQWKQGSATTPLNPDPAAFKTEEDAPVEKVSWQEVQLWLSYLNERTGVTESAEQFRMPTEAEWEYAARGGEAWNALYEYSGSDTIGTVAWYELNSGKRTHTVGTLYGNQLGLYDMSGNVWEWVQDRYGAYQSTAQQDPAGPEVGPYRIVRGGSWLLSHGSSRIANRNMNPPDWRGSCTGFRLARSQ